MADEQELPAYPIRAYQLIPDPNQPAVVALAIETDQGHSLFLATREILGGPRQGSFGASSEDAIQAASNLAAVSSAIAFALSEQSRSAVATR